jgi:hypothetical protein
LDKVRLEREKRGLAIDHADGRVGDDAYLSRIKEIRSRLASFDAPQAGQVPAKRAAAWLAALGTPLQSGYPSWVGGPGFVPPGGPQKRDQQR